MNSYLMQILSATSLLAILSGCMGGAPTPAKTDKSLPKVAINGYLSDMTSAAFEWKPIDDARVQGVYVYRNNPESETPTKLIYVGAVNGPKITHYLDSELQPDTEYLYRFSTFAPTGNASLASELLKVHTKPRFASVSFFTASGPMPRAAKLIWRPHTDHSVVAYKLERRVNGSDKFVDIATIEGRLNAEYIDENLKDNTRYEYRLRAITYNDIFSKPSKSVHVTTVALPSLVEGTSASQNIAGSIEVRWNNSDLSKLRYYRVFRSSSANGSYDLLADEQKGPLYRDKVTTPAQKYFYKVVGVNKEKLQGELKSTKATMGMTLNAPHAPTNLVAMVENSTVQLTWKSTDSRIVSYTVIKEVSKGFMSSETKAFKNIKKTLKIDSSLKHGEAYTFSVVGVDKHGIVSAPSNSVSVQLQQK